MHHGTHERAYMNVHTYTGRRAQQVPLARQADQRVSHSPATHPPFHWRGPTFPRPPPTTKDLQRHLFHALAARLMTDRRRASCKRNTNGDAHGAGSVSRRVGRCTHIGAVTNQQTARTTNRHLVLRGASF